MQAAAPGDEVVLAGGLTLARFRPLHAAALVPMWRESFEHGVGVVDPNPIEEQAAYLRDEVVPYNDIRVAFLGGEMVGFVAASPTSIAQLYVRVGRHRQGIGTALLAWAQSQSAGSLRLHTFARNAGARAFYERHGFRIVERGHEPVWGLEDLKYQWNAATGGR